MTATTSVLIRSFTGAAAVVVIAACSAPPTPAAAPGASPSSTPTAETTPAERPRPEACALVTQAEMSAILGGAVIAQGDTRPGSTTCTFTAATGVSPYAELKVDWGSGDGAMMATGMMGHIEPGINNPLEVDEGRGRRQIAAGHCSDPGLLTLG